MPYKTGYWGEQAKRRSKKRLKYFKKYQYKRYRKNNKPMSLGYRGEEEANNLLKGSKRQERNKADLMWQGKRIEVKTAKPTRSLGHKKDWWKFLLYKQKGKTDYFLFICKDKEERTICIFLIPDKDLEKNNFCFSMDKLNIYKKYLLKILK